MPVAKDYKVPTTYKRSYKYYCKRGMSMYDGDNEITGDNRIEYTCRWDRTYEHNKALTADITCKCEKEEEYTQKIY